MKEMLGYLILKILMLQNVRQHLKENLPLLYKGNMAKWCLIKPKCSIFYFFFVASFVHIFV
jgi:hypothetical protein